MSIVEDHYRHFLAAHYTWMSGGLEQKVDQNRRFFESILDTASAPGKAIDLGCGSGFQSLALASLRFEVVAIDSSPDLIGELRDHATNLPIQAIVADLRDANVYSKHGPYQLAVCMGDTLLHLPSDLDADQCLADVHRQLAPNGTLVLSFRDLTNELQGIDRAIPVRLDDDRLMATFLEYEPEHVVVNDLLFLRSGDTWTMQKSAYRKLRLSPSTVTQKLTQIGYTVSQQTIDRGFVTIVAKKS